MGVFNFTGKIDGVRQAQLDFISEALEKQGFKGPDANMEPVGAVGDNYMANVVRITVTENGRTFKMIAKLAPVSEMLRQISQVGKVYKNESIVYSELLPKYVQLQRNAGVKNLFRFAECYGCLDEAPNEVILLEDLKESKFVMLDRFKPLSNEAVKITLKNFAILHSLSYALRDQEPETFKSVKVRFGDLLESPMSKSETGSSWFKQLEETVLSIVSEQYKQHVEGLSNIVQLHTEIGKEDEGSKFTVIQHGDGWTNNIMFRIEDNVATESVLVDYQLARERNPAQDIMFFIFNSTSHEQRQQHYTEFLDHYHKELDLSLNNYGLEASTVFPREQMDKDLKRYGRFMLFMCIMISNMIMKQRDEAARMLDLMSSQTDAQMRARMAGTFHLAEGTRARLKRKVEGLVDSFVELGYV